METVVAKSNTSTFIAIGKILYTNDIGFLTKEQCIDLERAYTFKPEIMTIYNFIGPRFPNDMIMVADTQHEGIYIVTKETL